MQIKYLLPLIIVLLLSCTDKHIVEDRPNIILVMVDDMGYSDLSFFGSLIETPNIDNLASNGLVFSQFYNTSRCCPSRAALLTGLYQHQTGVGDMTGNYGHPNYQGFLNEKCITTAEVLKKVGYQTMMVGKWHVGNKKEHWPRQRGFDKFYGIPDGGGVYFYPFVKPRTLVLNDSIKKPDHNFYSTTAFNAYSLKFIQEALGKNAPFFLYMAHIAPHFPLQAPKEKYQKYLGRFMAGFQERREARLKTMIQRGLLPSDMKLGSSDSLILQWKDLDQVTREKYDLEMAIYAAQLEMVDDGIGSIINLLNEKGKAENTIIIFLSDNGASHEERYVERVFAEYDGEPGSKDAYRAYSRSWAHVSNTPFRLYKHWVHEGGISSPLIIHYPQMIEHNRVDHSVLHIMDIMPTLMELGKATYPSNPELYPLQGKSFVPLIKKSQTWDRGITFWEHQGNRAVREGDWKIVSAHPYTTWVLYNMADDRMESKDLSKGNPEIKYRLINAYHDWSEQTGVLTRKEIRNIK